jgi:hypothetical protein
MSFLSHGEYDDETLVTFWGKTFGVESPFILIKSNIRNVTNAKPFT